MSFKNFKNPFKHKCCPGENFEIKIITLNINSVKKIINENWVSNQTNIGFNMFDMAFSFEASLN
jgi:hypothetical protein